MEAPTSALSLECVFHLPFPLLDAPARTQPWDRDGDGTGCLGGSVKHPTSAQVMISRFVGLSPTSGYVLTVQSLEPALDSVSPSLSLSLSLSVPPMLTLSPSLSLSLSKINIKKLKQNRSGDGTI